MSILSFPSFPTIKKENKPWEYTLSFGSFDTIKKSEIWMTNFREKTQRKLIIIIVIQASKSYKKTLPSGANK